MLVASNRRMQQMLYDHARWMAQHRARHQEMVRSQLEEIARTRRQETEHQRTRYQEMLRARYEEMHQRLQVLAITREDTVDPRHPNSDIYTSTK